MSGTGILVRVPTALRGLVAGASSITVDLPGPSPTVGAVLDVLAKEHPALERRVRDERGVTRVHVNVFVGADNIRDLQGLDTAVTGDDDISIIAAVSGGT
jgi:molybdopterin converting factor small subunit